MGLIGRLLFLVTAMLARLLAAIVATRLSPLALSLFATLSLSLGILVSPILLLRHDDSSVSGFGCAGSREPTWRCGAGPMPLVDRGRGRPHRPS